MEVKRTAIPEVVVLTPRLIRDSRGFFLESFNARDYEGISLPTNFKQDNHSGSFQGVLRGLHYQIRHPQGKLIRVSRGEIFDVAVDLRQSSSTFGKWVGVHLSADNFKLIWIPPGFAHGFYTLSDWADVIYKATEYYSQEWDRTLRWDDPSVGIRWPLIDNATPTLSEKDARGAFLRVAELFP